MRFAIVLVLIATTAYADPFDQRQPISPPSSTEPVAAPVAPRTELVDPGKTQRMHAKLFLAAGVTLGTASLITTLYAKHEYDAALNGYATGSGPVSYDAAVRANHYRDLARYGGTGLFLAGAAAVGAAAYLYFTAERDLVRRPIVAPMVSGDQAGVSVVGAF